MINLHSQGSTGCKDMPAQQFFIFSQLTLLQNCRAVYGRAAAALCAAATCRLGRRSNACTIPIRNIALNPHKQVISLH
jgi:hypothetical protein